MAQKDPVVILGVIYNTFPETIRFIESIKLCFDNEVKVILVDNSEIPPDSLFTEKIHSCDFITYIKTEKNIGYFHGAKLGLMHFMENNPNYPQWTIVCNVDIFFETPLLSKKLDSFENVPDLGIIAPAIISDRWKTDFNPFRMSRISLKKLYFYQMIYSNTFFHNGYILIHHFKKSIKLFLLMISAHRKSEITAAREIYAPHGSCIIFNKNYFERGGTLDHVSFLFNEEIFVGETATRLGLKILYVPELKVCHYEHSSIGNFISRKINGFYRQSIEDIIMYYYQ